MRQTADTDPTTQARALATREGAARLHTEDTNMSTYNGWTNYETWNVNLWIDNDESGQALKYELTRAARRSRTPKTTLADALKSTVEEMMPDLGASMAADLLGAAVGSVNWYEIAENWLQDEDEDDTDDDEEEDTDTDD